MRVRYSELSRHDFREIADYLIEHAGSDMAYKVIDEIERVITKVLLDNPSLGTTALESIPEIKFFPAGKYSVYQIYYQVQGDTLEVYRVLHGRRDIENIL